jgi:uncharacterized membrane protein YphA (DoxX/SURF4 family)
MNNPSNPSGSSSSGIPFGWLPDWVGFVIIIAVGIAAIIIGFIVSYAGLVAIGVAAIASAILAWVAGAQSAPAGNPIKRDFAGRVRNVPDKTWYIIFALIVIAIVIAVISAL